MEPMKHIRIGKDISLRWAITTDGAAIPLQGRDLTLEMKSPIGKVIILPYRIEGNVLSITYYGYEQTVVGEYSLTLWENKGKPGQNVVDAVRAFKLVRTSPEEEDFTGGDLQVESVDLGTANLEILSGGGAATPGESPDLSALEEKVDVNTSSISNLNAELDHVKEVQEGQNNSIAQISTTMQGIKTEQTEQNKRLDDHEERLVYTESDLVKVREEYDGIISELVKSIAHTQKAFVVETNDSEWYIYIDNVKKTIPANSIKGFHFNSSFVSNTSKNPGIASFRFLVTDTSEIKSMNGMFQGCSKLTSLDLSSFDTSAVTDMGSTFKGCSKLTSLDLSSFDTSAVNRMELAFYYCSSLTSLDLSSFDTSAVNRMGSIFDGCTSLTSLLLGPNFFKTSALTVMVFSQCSKWGNETVVTSLVTNSYDRAAAGLNTLTLKLHANTKAALTDEQKATITSKSYTIA